MSRGAAIGLALWLALGCAGAPVFETPEERTAGTPLSESVQLRSGELTWRSRTLESRPDGLLLEFTLMNGTSRDYLSTMLRIVLRGPKHSLATVRYPAGPLAAGASRRVRAHLPPPGFTVLDTDLELIFAQE